MKLSFALWTVFFLALVVWYFSAGRKRKRDDAHSCDVVDDAMPQIRGVADRMHTQAFGRPSSEFGERHLKVVKGKGRHQ